MKEKYHAIHFVALTSTGLSGWHGPDDVAHDARKSAESGTTEDRPLSCQHIPRRALTRNAQAQLSASDAFYVRELEGRGRVSCGGGHRLGRRATVPGRSHPLAHRRGVSTLDAFDDARYA